MAETMINALEGLKVLTYIVGFTSLIMALLGLIAVIAQTNYGQPMKLQLNYSSQDGAVSDDEINAIMAKLIDRIKNGPNHPRESGHDGFARVRNEECKFPQR